MRVIVMRQAWWMLFWTAMYEIAAAYFEWFPSITPRDRADTVISLVWWLGAWSIFCSRRINEENTCGNE